MASDYDFGGPGVVKPHPKKNWVNPDARQVAYGSGESKKRGPSRPSGPSRPTGPSRESEPSREDGPSRARGSFALSQVFAGLIGLAFLLAGVGGFIPGITSHTGDLASYGLDSKAELLGLFRVSVLHNVVHLLFAVGLLAALRASTARLYLLVGGVLYLVVAAYGYIVDQASDSNFLPINDADTLLHIGLGLAMVLLGVVATAADKRRGGSA